MTVTPRDIARLALSRHRQPWNWTFQTAAVGVVCLALLLHNFLLFATALILFAAGFYEWGLPVRDNRWFRFVARAVDWEKNWLAAPWNWHKWWRFLFLLSMAAVLVWALWTGEAMTLGLFMGFAFLVRVVRDNRDGGIEL